MEVWIVFSSDGRPLLVTAQREIASNLITKLGDGSSYTPSILVVDPRPGLF